jgi:hypothetical protein
VPSPQPLVLPIVRIPEVNDALPFFSCFLTTSLLLQVQLQLRLDESNLVTQGHASVEYILTGGDWDEDDFISLHALSPNDHLPNESNQISFEYTSPPQLSPNGKNFRGLIQISLPFYGGLFSLRYQRVNVTILPVSQQIQIQESSVTDEKNLELESHPPPPSQQNALVSRDYLPLASSELFSVAFPVQLHSQLCRARNGRGYDLIELRDPPPSTASSAALHCLVEDLQNIQALVVTVVSKTFTPSCCLTKPTSWLAKNLSPSGLSLVVECDVVLESDAESQRSQEPNWISIPLPSQDFELVWMDSYGLVEAGDHKSSSPFGNRIVIKIPYASRATLPLGLMPSPKTIPSSFCGLTCRSCGAELLSSGAISRILPLPSGLFDQVMHEFLCSETQPTMPLSMTDFTTPRGNISIGEIFLSVHPLDLKDDTAATDRLQFHCKMAPSLLDVIGGSLVKSLPQFGLSEHSSTLSLVDASTCSIKCSRCQSVLGDGLIASDLDSHDESSTLTEAIHLADLQDIRFLRSEVRWQPCGQETNWGGEDLISFLTEPCTAEQVVSNTFLWLVNRYDVTSFELCVTDWTDRSTKTTLRLRLLSRSQREGEDLQVSRLRSGYSVLQFHGASCPAVDLLPPLRRAVKLSYRLCSPEEGEGKTKSPKPISIPVSFSDYCEVSFYPPLPFPP